MPNITTNHAITYTNTTNWNKNKGRYRLSIFFSLKFMAQMQSAQLSEAINSNKIQELCLYFKITETPQLQLVIS